jgi:hypothetical protein
VENVNLTFTFLELVFPLMALIGFAIGYINGAMGMGYGVISTSLLLAIGITPAIASASTRTAKLSIALITGVSHWKLGNLRRDIGVPMILPGMAGGVFGAYTLYALSQYETEIKPLIASFLLLIGFAVFLRFLFRKQFLTEDKPFSRGRLGILAFFAAFSDALLGGGWGPITAPILILSNKSTPRKVIGSTDTAAFFITAAETFTFLWLLGAQRFRWDWILALMIGGGIAAPLAAYTCKRVPPRLLGTSIGLILITTNLWTITSLLL